MSLSWSRELYACGNSVGQILISNFPYPDVGGLVVASGHAGCVTGIAWVTGDHSLISIGARDHSIFQWSVIEDTYTDESESSRSNESKSNSATAQANIDGALEPTLKWNEPRGHCRLHISCSSSINVKALTSTAHNTNTLAQGEVRSVNATWLDNPESIPQWLRSLGFKVFL